jgi:hypothetical protein
VPHTSHRDQACVAQAHKELAAIVQKRGWDRVEVLIPLTATEVGSRRRQPPVVKLADGKGIAGLKPPYL